MAEATKCQYYLQKKRRYCKFDAVPGKEYCGNHLFLHDDASGRRVPCPADPKHTVLLSELEVHLRKCPSALLAAQDKARAHNVQGVNGGADSEAEPDMTPLRQHSALTAEQPPAAPMPISPFARGRAAGRAAHARSMGQEAFQALIEKVMRTHARECGSRGPPLRQLRPTCTEHLMASAGDARPFDLKHAVQQASILGNMLEVGLLPLGPPPPAPPTGVLVELGAGKAGLAGMAVAMRHPSVGAAANSSAPANQAAAVLPASDADASTNGSPSEPLAPASPPKSTQVPSQAAAPAGALVDPVAVAPRGGAYITAGGKPVSAGATNGGWARALVGGAPVGCGACTAVLVDNRSAFQAKADRHMRGLAEIERITIDLKDFALWHVPGMRGEAAADGAGVARPQRGGPHPRQPCTSQTQVEAAAPASTGDAEPVTAAGASGRQDAGTSTSGQGPHTQRPWVACGKHLCGAATDFSLRCCFAHLTPLRGEGKEAAGARHECAAVWRDFQGIAFATCCHHRCGWQPFVGKAAWREWGLSPSEFELVSWMTGWALCGHDAAPGCGQEGEDGEAEGEEGGDASVPCHKRRQTRAAGAEGVAAGDGGAERRVAPRGATPSAGVTSAHACADVGNVTARVPPAAATAPECEMGEGGATAAPDGVEGAAAHEWDPARALPRASRMVIGAACKALIDRARLLWVCSQLGLSPPPAHGYATWQEQQQSVGVDRDQRLSRTVQLVAYVAQEVSGENKLLLVRM